MNELASDVIRRDSLSQMSLNQNQSRGKTLRHSVVTLVKGGSRHSGPRGQMAATAAGAILAALVLLAGFAVQASFALGAESGDEVCDSSADYFLGMEDYSEAIIAHRRFLKAHPDDALAHYHLGFAYGMVGRLPDEIMEYRRAADLGLGKWDLFLNMGVAYLEENDLPAAAAALRRAVVLGPNHPEAHFNLALSYQRAGRTFEARDELLRSLRLDPNQPDASNMLGVVYAERGDYVRAENTWRDLSRRHPDFIPARENLTILGLVEAGAGADIKARRVPADGQRVIETSPHDSASQRVTAEQAREPTTLRQLSGRVHD